MHFISNTKRLFFETVSPKKHGKVYLNRKGYQDALFVSFTATPYNITTYMYTGVNLYSTSSNVRNGFATRLCSSFGVSYQINLNVGMKWRALKARQVFLFWSSEKRCKGFF